jgi:hypothetical protein
MLPCVLDQIPADEIVVSVSDDGAYDTKGCHEALAKRGTQAIIPIRRNAKPWKDQGLGTTVRNAFLRPRIGLARKSERGEAPITGAALWRLRWDASNSLVNAS